MKKELVAMIVAGTMIVTMGPIAIASQRPEDDLTMMLPENQYELRESVEVNGRQGVCSEGNYHPSETVPKHSPLVTDALRHDPRCVTSFALPDVVKNLQNFCADIL